MKNIAIIILVLAILAAGVIGLLLVFGLLDADRAGPMLLKTVGGFVILGACAAAISALMPAKKEPQD